MDAAPTTMAVPRRGLRRAVLLVLGMALFLGFVSLGTWQVQRRTWKLDLIERVDQRVHAAPVALPPVAQWPGINAAHHEYLPVVFQGRLLPDKTVLTQAVTELGAGFWVMTALQQDDGTQVLVNRGFVPQDQRAQWIATPLPPGTPAAATVQGLLRMTEPDGGFLRSNSPAQQRWYSRDVAAIAQAVGLTRAAPFFVDAGLPGAASAAPAAAAWSRAGMTVVKFHNSHLVYALTWYAMALMVVGAGWYVARYEARLRARAAPATPSHEPPSS